MRVQQEEDEGPQERDAIVEEDAVYDHRSAARLGWFSKQGAGDISEDACRFAVAGGGELNDGRKGVEAAGNQGCEQQGLDEDRRASG